MSVLYIRGADGKLIPVKTIQGPQGPQGEKGEPGATGAAGYTPIRGIDYWTDADKTEIAAKVPIVKVAEQPTFANGTSEMTDTSKVYVNLETGTFWQYKEATVTREVTVDVDEGYTYPENSRLGSDGTVATSGSYAGYTVTPFIDLLAYPVPFTLHLEGAEFMKTTSDSYTRCATYTEDQTKITSNNVIAGEFDNYLNVSDSNCVRNEDGSGTITFVETPTGANGTAARYVRFSAKTFSTPSVYVTYDETVTETTWVDTGIQYGGVDTETVEVLSVLNNEGADPETVTLLPADVLSFYNSAAYPDDDYTVTHLSKITYPYRADIPVPYTVKWAHREDAMRTTVAVDTKAIGTVNNYTMLTYDATGFDNYPLYNLLPGMTYYYKVTHVLSDGSLVEVKSGSFTTSSETLRLLYIDGTQNVRDLGGWVGLDGKTVKYGKLIRGAASSDSSYPELLLTGKGRRALGELKVQAELNLGAADTETSISATCDYKKVGYSNYATAITDATARANFKTVLETIVGWLSETTPRNIYMHCQGGCDRTGTLAFQLLGLLGVSESDLAKEYELSSFSSIGFGRRRTTTKAVDTYDYVGMVQAIKAYSGDTITDKFYAFATNATDASEPGCGISADTVTSFRSLMLE